MRARRRAQQDSVSRRRALGGTADADGQGHPGHLGRDLGRRSLELRSRLIFFEGPDGTGKTTLHNLVAARVSPPPIALAFPGNDAGTLGRLVYDIHHGAPGIQQPSEAPLQLLHIAAHLDAIDRVIRPAIDSGITVLLDRYWWSTWTYGTEAGIDPALLDKMIEIERIYWGELAPDLGFLVMPPRPYNDEIEVSRFKRLSALYREVARVTDHSVDIMDQQMTRDEAAAYVVARLARLSEPKGHKE